MTAGMALHVIVLLGLRDLFGVVLATRCPLQCFTQTEPVDARKPVSEEGDLSKDGGVDEMVTLKRTVGDLMHGLGRRGSGHGAVARFCEYGNEHSG
jgi:hypothetical protein